MKSLEQFKNDTMGGSFANPGTGTYKGQCVSYVRLYMEQVLGIKTAVWGHALSYWTNPAVLQHFDRVASPRDGDIVVWGNDPGAWTGPEGHIAIWYQNKILNQNYGGSLRVSINKMFTPGLLGYLRRKGGDMPIPDQENYYGRYGINLALRLRGRQLSREEFRKHIVGKTDLRAIELLSDDPEAQTAQHWQNVGKVAVNDNWQKQIGDLVAERDALKRELVGGDADKKLQTIKDALGIK